MSTNLRRAAPAVVGLLAIGLALLARAAEPDAFGRAQEAIFDAYQRAAPWRAPERGALVVDIDEASLAKLGQWPWPRSTLADLTRALQDLGASATAFDAVFAEPDRASPARLAAAWRDQFGADLRSPAALPDYDADFAEALGRGRMVTGFALLPAPGARPPRVAPSLAAIGGDPRATLTSFEGAVTTLPALEDAAAGDGAVAMAESRDSVVRRIPLLMNVAGRIVPSLALETLRVAADESTLKVRLDRDTANSPVLGLTLGVGDLEIPASADGTMRLHFGPRPAGSTIAAWRLLDPFERERLKPVIENRIVLIGTSAVGLADLRATPLNPLEAGVNIHAAAIDQILAGHFLNRPLWAPGAEIFGGVALALTLIALAAFAPLGLALASGAASLAATGGAGLIAFTAAGWLIDPALPLALAAPALLATSFARYFGAERDAAKLRTAFSRYLAPALVEALVRDPSRLELGGELRELSFVFTDLEGFTDLVERTDPKALVALLNAYLDGLCRIAMDHGGAVDKIVGDALHVIFNAPLDQPDHAARAVRCALAIDRFAEAYREDCRRRGIAFGATRVGVNTGPAVVGNFGGATRFDYTAHGDAINIAARLEAANKTLGTRICVAKASLEKAGIDGFAPVGALMLKGKSRGVEAFVPADEAWRVDYCAAYAKLGSAEGARAMLELAARHPEAPALALQAKRIRAGEGALAIAV